ERRALVFSFLFRYTASVPSSSCLLMVGNSKASVLVRLEFNELIELVSCPRNTWGTAHRLLTKIIRGAHHSSLSHRQTNLSDIHQSALRRDRDRLSSANRVQLFQNNLHVVFHRVF